MNKFLKKSGKVAKLEDEQQKIAKTAIFRWKLSTLAENSP